MSTASQRSRAAATIARQSAARVTSAANTLASPPSVAICFAVSSAFSALRSTHSTRAPSRAKSRAAALPLPRPGPREPAPVTMATLPSRRPATSSALEGAVDADVDDVGAARGEPAVDGGPHVRGLLHELTRHALGLGEADVVEARVDEVHGHVLVVLGGEALEGEGALLEDAIGGVVEDDPHHGDRIVRGRPEGLDRVHGAAVADEGDHGPRGLGELDPEGGGESPADAAPSQAEEALGIARAQEL